MSSSSGTGSVRAASATSSGTGIASASTPHHLIVYHHWNSGTSSTSSSSSSSCCTVTVSASGNGSSTRAVTGIGRLSCYDACRRCITGTCRACDSGGHSELSCFNIAGEVLSLPQRRNWQGVASKAGCRAHVTQTHGRSSAECPCWSHKARAHETRWNAGVSVDRVSRTRPHLRCESLRDCKVPRAVAVFDDKNVRGQSPPSHVCVQGCTASNGCKAPGGC